MQEQAVDMNERLLENKANNKLNTNKPNNKLIDKPIDKDAKSTRKTLQVNETGYVIRSHNPNSHLQSGISNRIESSKYTWLNCLPKILIEQFTNVGNIYFLVLAVLQLIPSISNSGSTPVNFIPLTIVVTVNGIKDVVEDYKRKVADRLENNTKVQVLTSDLKRKEGYKELTQPSNDGFGYHTWENLNPGDFVKIKKGETFPSDLLLIYSSNAKGVAYVETKSLDGETNLKLKESIKHTYLSLSSLIENDRMGYLKRLKLELNCEMPNDKMYVFNGSVVLDSSISKSKTFAFAQQSDHGANIDTRSPRNERIDEVFVKDDNDETEKRLDSFDPGYKPKIFKSEMRMSSGLSITGGGLSLVSNQDQPKEHAIASVGYDNLLLRGSILKQTDFIYAMVVYAGHSTKIMKNSLSARSKRSKLSNLMNNYLTSVLLIQCFICLFATIVFRSERGTLITFKDYISEAGFVATLQIFFVWFLNLQNIIPISLIMTMEMIKFCQALYIMWDTNLYCKPLKQPCVVQSSSLNEELGQVRHIFTDKTGTLTKNYMQLKCVLAGDQKYGLLDEEQNDEHLEDSFNYKQLPNVKFYDPRFWKDWGYESPYFIGGSEEQLVSENQNQNEHIKELVFALGLCHSVVAEKSDDKSDQTVQSNQEVLNPLSCKPGTSEIVYNASSPDELALVNGSRFFGLTFLERHEDNSMTLDFYCKKYKYQLLNIFEFNSDRKRMSVVIKDSGGKISIITKGADSVILKRLKEGACKAVSELPKWLEYFGHQGLRTLLFAKRDVSDYEYASFVDTYNVKIFIRLQ